MSKERRQHFLSGAYFANFPYVYSGAGYAYFGGTGTGAQNDDDDNESMGEAAEGGEASQ